MALSGDAPPQHTAAAASISEVGDVVKSLSHQFAETVRRHPLPWSIDAREHSWRRVPIHSRWSLPGLRVPFGRSGGRRI